MGFLLEKPLLGRNLCGRATSGEIGKSRFFRWIFCSFKNTHFCFRPVACCFADLRKYRHRKKTCQKNGGHIGVTVFSLSASSTEKHSMKPTAISSPEKIGQPCSPKKEKFIDSNQHHWNFFQGQTAKELAVFVCRFLGTSIYPPEV